MIGKDTRTKPQFADPSFNFYVNDADRSASLNCDLFGFEVTFKTPQVRTPEHIEVKKRNIIIGFATHEAAKRFHGLETMDGPAKTEIVLWSDEVDSAFDFLV